MLLSLCDYITLNLFFFYYLQHFCHTCFTRPLCHYLCHLLSGNWTLFKRKLIYIYRVPCYPSELWTHFWISADTMNCLTISKLYLPVIMTERMLAALRVRITGAVCGLSWFCSTSNPRKVKSFSTLSLEVRKIHSEYIIIHYSAIKEERNADDYRFLLQKNKWKLLHLFSWRTYMT